MPDAIIGPPSPAEQRLASVRDALLEMDRPIINLEYGMMLLDLSLIDDREIDPGCLHATVFMLRRLADDIGTMLNDVREAAGLHRLR